MIEKTYIGDSVYVAWNGYDYTLTTENGMGPSNTIILDPDIFRELVRFVERCDEFIKAHTP